MDSVKIRVTLEIPKELILPLATNPHRALVAILTGALAEFRIIVTEVNKRDMARALKEVK